MVKLLWAEPRGEKIARAICTVRKAINALSVEHRNMLLILQCSLRVIAKETGLFTLFPDNILHARYNSLLDTLRKISQML